MILLVTDLVFLLNNQENFTSMLWWRNKLYILTRSIFQFPKEKNNSQRKTNAINRWDRQKDIEKHKWKGNVFLRQSWERKQKNKRKENKLKKGLSRPSKDIWKSRRTSRLKQNSKEEQEKIYRLEEALIWINWKQKMRSSLQKSMSLRNSKY